MSDWPLKKIVSGGQTGADRAGLDFAIAHKIPHGGWCPQGRTAEDGPVDWRYRLKETPSPSYTERTEWNVRDSDGTVVLSLGPELFGGSRLTVELAARHGKPCLHVSKATTAEPAAALSKFLADHQVAVLNVAGTRESSEPGIGVFVMEVLKKAFAGSGG